MVWALPRSLATTEGIISLFSLPPGTKMFQFPGLALTTMRKWLFFKQPGCPIRKSSDQRLFAPTRSLSQLITSFIASVSLGIHHTPLLTFFCSRLIYYQHYNNSINIEEASLILSAVKWNLFLSAVRPQDIWFLSLNLVYSTVLLVSICQRSLR